MIFVNQLCLFLLMNRVWVHSLIAQKITMMAKQNKFIVIERAILVLLTRFKVRILQKDRRDQI